MKRVIKYVLLGCVLFGSTSLNGNTSVKPEEVKTFKSSKIYIEQTKKLDALEIRIDKLLKNNIK